MFSGLLEEPPGEPGHHSNGKYDRKDAQQANRAVEQNIQHDFFLSLTQTNVLLSVTD